MKRFLPISYIALFVFGGLLAVVAPRPCPAELDDIDLMLREANSKDESPAPQIGPGKETKVRGKDLGEDGYYMLYLPKDYTPARAWPVIFCYHSLNSKPTVEPFRTILKGEQFVLVGVGYQQAGREGYDYMKTADVEILKRVLRSVNRHVKMNRNQLFVGGFSKGAFYAASMLNNMPEAQWAGGVILGGGMSEAATPKKPQALYKLPVFLACGEKDSHRQYVETAADHFKAMNSDVTLELWPKTGHVEMYPGSKLREWLIQNGLLRNASERLAKAKVYEKTRHLGEALDIYESLAHVDDGDVICQQADIGAQALLAKAQETQGRVGTALDRKNYALAQDLLSELAVEFKGSRVGDDAAEQLEKLKNDPAVQKTIARRQTQEEAEELEKQAITAEKDGRYAEAIQLYEKYLRLFPEADNADDVKKQLENLRSDDNLQKRIRDQEAARECRGWLNMADAFLQQNKPDKAKPYLDNIIRKYPDTTWATKARVRLRNL